MVPHDAERLQAVVKCSQYCPNSYCTLITILARGVNIVATFFPGEKGWKGEREGKGREIDVLS